jgi:hypothetical protein
MESEHVSSPHRPPRYHLFFKTNDRLFTAAFRTVYAAHTAVTEVLTGCAEHGILPVWADSRTIILTHPDATLTIREHNLEEIIEYTPKKDEAEWLIPYPLSLKIRQLRTFWSLSPTSVSEELPTTTPKVKKEPAPTRRHKTTKAPPTSDQITVAQIAEQANIPPNKARNILRKANIQKPEQGWTFNISDPMVETIRTLLRKG